MPSILTSQRSRLVTKVAAGALIAATIGAAAAAAIPSASAAEVAGTAGSHLTALTQPQDSMSAAQRLIGFDRVRFSLGARQLEHDVAVAKAAAAKAAAKAAAAKAAAAKAAANEAAAKAAAIKAAAVKAVTLRETAATPSGSPEQIAQQMLSRFGWSSSEFSSLYPLWQHESRWDPSAQNAGSGAFGIPQALPGSQMASAGPDWQTNPATQIKWGLTYIQSRYGSPSGALAHEQAYGWY